MILKWLRKGRLGTGTFCYFPLAIIEIASVFAASTSGELNTAGWIAGVLGIFICFPWYLIAIEILEALSLRPDDYFKIIGISSVCINIIIIYFIDGSNYRNSGEPSYENRK